MNARKVIEEETGEKRIEDVLPEMIRIAAEGDAVDRIADYLIHSGWTKMDVWREVKKLNASSVFTNSLQNEVSDRLSGFKKTGHTNLAADLKRDHRWLAKGRKK